MSTRGSNTTSSERWVRRVWTHSPESPEAASVLEPNIGAVAPLLARHTISPPRSSAMAAPVAPVVRQACSTTSFSTISRARSEESSGGRPPPLCAEKHAANCAKSVSKRASAGWARSTPVAPSRGFEGSGPDVEGCAITVDQWQREPPVRSGVSPENGGLSICAWSFRPFFRPVRAFGHGNLHSKSWQNRAWTISDCPPDHSVSPIPAVPNWQKKIRLQHTGKPFLLP